VGTLDYKLSYRRNLPHSQPPGATFFVTARLAGSLPKTVIRQWNKERKWLAELNEKNPKHFERIKSEFERAWFGKFEKILDGAECGPTWLADYAVAAQIAESLHYRDGKVFRLDCFSIMLNHLHVLFKPLLLDNQLVIADEEEGPVFSGDPLKYHSLASIMKSLKGYTARQCNELLNRRGDFWAHESYDHYVRDAQEWRRIEAYILNNPVKARLVDEWQMWKWSYRRKNYS